MLYNGDTEWKRHSSVSSWSEQTQCQDVEPEWKRQRSWASVLSKQKTQPDGDEEPCQYGLCCDACRAEGEDTRLLKDGGRKDCGGGQIDHGSIPRFRG